MLLPSEADEVTPAHGDVVLDAGGHVQSQADEALMLADAHEDQRGEAEEGLSTADALECDEEVTPVADAKEDVHSVGDEEARALFDTDGAMLSDEEEQVFWNNLGADGSAEVSQPPSVV